MHEELGEELEEFGYAEESRASAFDRTRAGSKAQARIAI